MTFNNTHIDTAFYRGSRVCSWFAFIAITVILLLSSLQGYSQAEEGIIDEVSVTLNVPRIGSLELPAVIYSQEAYLPVKELFDFLKIKNEPSAEYDSVKGFFINPKATFIIDKPHNRIIYEDKVFELNPSDLIRTETSLYLKYSYFGKVFGLDCVFNFRSLSIVLTTKIELPAIREMQQEQMHRNISQIKGEKKADTIINRQFAWFRLGMADWTVSATQQSGAGNIARVNLGLGAVIAGGEADVYLNYSSNQPFLKKQQFYKWRYVNNDNEALRQISIGKMYVQGASSIYTPINGFQITNTPTTYKKSFGTYTISDNTKPGWVVELYVNNVLVNYTKADASGFFTFEVPMVYGNSSVKLRFYGPWGEEETREQNLNIPYNFVPLGQLEYSLSGGIAEDDLNSRFSRTNFSYGLSRRITIGGGMEYLSSVSKGKLMPFANASFRLGSNILVSGEHIFGVRSKGNINYRLPSNLQVDLNYTKYDKDQTAVRYSYIEEKKAIISMPFHSRKFVGLSRFTLNQYTMQNAKNMPLTKNTSAEFLLSGSLRGLSTNITTSAIFADASNAFIYTNFSLTVRLPARIRLTPQAQYNYSEKRFAILRLEAEKPVFKQGYINLAYTKEVATKVNAFSIGFRYNFSFAQTAVSAAQIGTTTLLTQSARGSIMYNGQLKTAQFNDQNNVGRGGLIILPFLDLNANGRRDANEPKAYGLNLRVNGGRIERNNGDTTIRILSLEAFSNFFIELDKNSFENVSWQIRKPVISAEVEANYFKVIEVPVSVMGEASGTVSLKRTGVAGLGRIIVNFFDKKSKLVGHILTESDGYFSFMALPPGTYTAAVDESQLQKLHMKASAPVKFTIKSSKDGDVVDSLSFTVEDIAESK